MSEQLPSKEICLVDRPAQVLVQIGVFSLAALLHSGISRRQTGSQVGIVFAAYVLAVPALVALTDRVATRNVYVIGAGLTALPHFGFVLMADGFWWGLALRAAAGMGWAGVACLA